MGRIWNFNIKFDFPIQVQKEKKSQNYLFHTFSIYVFTQLILIHKIKYNQFK